MHAPRRVQQTGLAGVVPGALKTGNQKGAAAPKGPRPGVRDSRGREMVCARAGPCGTRHADPDGQRAMPGGVCSGSGRNTARIPPHPVAAPGSIFRNPKNMILWPTEAA